MTESDREFFTFRLVKRYVQRTKMYPSPIGEFMAVIGLIAGIMLLFPLIILDFLYWYGKFLQDNLG